MATSNEQLEAAVKAAEDAVALVQKLKEESRAEDLKTVKELIARQSFTVNDLKPELKTRVAARKTSTPKKIVGRGRKAK